MENRRRSFMKTMNNTGRILALDFGSSRIGLALSDELRITAQPYGTLERSVLEEEIRRIEEIVSREGVVEIVVGLPKRQDGSLGEMAQAAKSFADAIRQALAITVRMWDERYSSHAAERILLEGNLRRAKRKKVVDQTAAAWILQGYLDSRAAR